MNVEIKIYIYQVCDDIKRAVKVQTLHLNLKLQAKIQGVPKVHDTFENR